MCTLYLVEDKAVSAWNCSCTLMQRNFKRSRTHEPNQTMSTAPLKTSLPFIPGCLSSAQQPQWERVEVCYGSLIGLDFYFSHCFLLILGIFACIFLFILCFEGFLL